MITRLSQDQLEDLMLAMLRRVPCGTLVRYVRSGAEYRMVCPAFRESDLVMLAVYSQMTTPTVVFSRPMVEFLSRFVRADGEPWP